MKPNVNGLPEASGSTSTNDRSPAGFLNAFQWRWQEKPDTLGNVQLTLNISKKEMERAFAGKQASQNGETYADLGVILSLPGRCTDRYQKKDGKDVLLKVDVTSALRTVVDEMRHDRDGDLNIDELNNVLRWAITQLKSGHNPKVELAELKAMAKHAAAVAAPVVEQPAAEGQEEKAG